jgi:fatty acid desaturase
MICPITPAVTCGQVQRRSLNQATVIRTGWEWLLTPLMMYQNYHLVHHLYPTVPFYRYKKAWLAREQFHESHQPAKVTAFQFFRE